MSVPDNDGIIEESRQPMLQAIANDDVARMQELIATPYVDVNDPKVSYQGAAVGNQNGDYTDVVQALINAGANPTLTTGTTEVGGQLFGRTFLHEAVACVHPAILEALVRALQR
jgi:hypothetical protein